MQFILKKKSHRKELVVEQSGASNGVLKGMNDSHPRRGSNVKDADDTVNNDSINFVDHRSIRYVITPADNFIGDIVHSVSPVVQRSNHDQMLRHEFRIYEKDPGIVIDNNDNVSNIHVQDEKQYARKHTTTAQRLKRWRQEVVRTFGSTALGASVVTAMLRCRSHTGQFSMNVRQPCVGLSSSKVSCILTPSPLERYTSIFLSLYSSVYSNL